MARYDWLPIFHGKLLTYAQQYALIWSGVIAGISVVSFIVYLIASKVASNEGDLHLMAKKRWMSKISNIAFNLAFIAFSFIPAVCSGFDVISYIEGIVGMMIICSILAFLNNGRRNWTSQRYTESALNNILIFVKICLKMNKTLKKDLVKAIIFSVLLTSFYYKTCLCYYHPEVGFFSQFFNFGVNTCFTRLFQLKDSCPPGPPCHMYATIPQDPSYAFFLNVHTHTDVSKLEVFYQELNTPDTTVFLNTTAETYNYHGLERKAARNVHSALILGLKADTQYLTKVFYNGQFWTNAIYRTLPNNNSRPIRMINGGDSGYTPAAVNLSKIAATLKPDIFFIGGDIAYDDNMPACAYTWDYFLGMYGRLTATLGYLMPIVSTVGNHDVGLNELPGINITVDNYGPAYFLYFPQHYDRNLDGHIIKRVPPLNHRRTVFGYTFANVHYLCLDTGYIQHFEGYQKQFMIQSFEDNRNKIKFVNYHVPIYSVCDAFDKDPSRYLYALFHWVPNFDKYKVMTSFQNHVHSFKRTKPLIGNTPKQNGTVYVGDGAYGAYVVQMCEPDVKYEIFQTFRKSNNMWYSEIYADRVEHTAYSSNGEVLDEFVQLVESYKL